MISSFRNISSQCFQRLGSPVTSRKYLRLENFTSISSLPKPVKLAFISYESMKDVTQTSTLFPIIIMHGLLGSKNNWNSLSKTIHKQTGRKVITIDARNHGDSPHSPEMSYAHMTEDIVQLIKDLNVAKVVLIGHSMGGNTVMYLALHYPHLVEKLAVIDMSPVRISPSLVDLIQMFDAMKTVTFDGNPTLSQARRMADKHLSFTIHSERIRQFLLMNLVETEKGTYGWRVNLPVLQKTFTNAIAVFPYPEKKVYAGPTLFIGGEESDYLKKEDHEDTRKLFPNAEFQHIPEAGHWVHVDKPIEFLNHINAFIKRP